MMFAIVIGAVFAVLCAGFIAAIMESTRPHNDRSDHPSNSEWMRGDVRWPDDRDT